MCVPRHRSSWSFVIVSPVCIRLIHSTKCVQCTYKATEKSMLREPSRGNPAPAVPLQYNERQRSNIEAKINMKSQTQGRMTNGIKIVCCPRSKRAYQVCTTSKYFFYCCWRAGKQGSAKKGFDHHRFSNRKCGEWLPWPTGNQHQIPTIVSTRDECGPRKTRPRACLPGSSTKKIAGMVEASTRVSGCASTQQQAISNLPPSLSAISPKKTNALQTRANRRRSLWNGSSSTRARPTLMFRQLGRLGLSRKVAVLRCCLRVFLSQISGHRRTHCLVCFRPGSRLEGLRQLRM